VSLQQQIAVRSHNAGLQDYRKKHDKLIERVAVTKMPTKYGEFKAYGYINLLNGEHHVALVKGEIGDGKDLCNPAERQL